MGWWREMEGKWNNEPDLLEMEGDGYHMVVMRNPLMGNLNGYVGVNINHPAYLKHYYDNKVDFISVHGGLTYCGLGKDMPDAPFKDNYWYFGFDTAHAFDVVPHLVAMESEMPIIAELKKNLQFFSSMESTYKDLNYVSDQVNALTEQLRLVKFAEPNHKINHKKMYRKLHKMKKG